MPKRTRRLWLTSDDLGVSLWVGSKPVKGGGGTYEEGKTTVWFGETAASDRYHSAFASLVKPGQCVPVRLVLEEAK